MNNITLVFISHCFQGFKFFFQFRSFLQSSVIDTMYDNKLRIFNKTSQMRLKINSDDLYARKIIEEKEHLFIKKFK